MSPSRAGSDARYRKSEQLLWANFCTALKSHTFTITVAELCRRSHIHPATFYRHAHDLDDFVAQQQTIIRQEFTAFCRTIANQPLPIVFRRLLIFIHKRRRFFTYISITDDLTFSYELLDQLRPTLTRHWPHYTPTLNQKIFLLYRSSLLAILTDWGHHQFAFTRIGHLTTKLTTLTQTAPRRFTSLVQS